MKKIDWVRKLTSRKLWTAVASFVSMMILATGGTDNTATQVTALIMAGASVVAYIIGEGLTDSANIGSKEDRVRMEKNKRPEITAMLSFSIQRHICPNNDPRIYWAREVTFDYATTNAVRVDFMKFKPVNNTVSGIEKGDFYCYEVKSSVEDFHSKNGHNFLGDYNYYVMPEEVYEQIKKEIPYQVGVYVPDGMNYRGEWYDLKAIKKAKRKDRSRPVSEMLLMMFRSAARDRKKALSDGY